MVFGDLIKESLKAIKDMSAREKWIFAPLIAMTLLLGVYPAVVTDVIGPSTEALVQSVNTAVADAGVLSDTAEVDVAVTNSH